MVDRFRAALLAAGFRGGQNKWHGSGAQPDFKAGGNLTSQFLEIRQNSTATKTKTGQSSILSFRGHIASSFIGSTSRKG
jgi:hypothetical protein